jgi:hypothetical protein
MTLAIRTAQKEHVCDNCGKKIPKGDKYWRRFTPMEECYEGMKPDSKEHTNCLGYEKERSDE